uniref:Uncharacterized protein n=1 Tax=Tanacetum cinerariifolium TaxID=118510 RepID=A0A699RG96_TANCI|nr:hypothetical protein [Tanacetum cinerariifolium]
MSCVLRFSAPNCDIDAIVATLDLPVESLYRQGEPRLVLRSRGPFTKSGFHVVTSEAAFEEFELQITETIAFIKSHRVALQQLAAVAVSLPEYCFVFDFGITTRMFDVAAQVDYFPPELVRLMGELGAGIKLSQYPSARDS